ncbi:MAG: hypothetical protein IJR63_08245 [Synergistaceae bacterium]|nr:hypothetical protein [Synergistaceae bacterium]
MRILYGNYALLSRLCSPEITKSAPAMTANFPPVIRELCLLSRLCSPEITKSAPAMTAKIFRL